jgi:3-deoxy-manno-octulosonate cytidylyltransferase (CMP-KDO synthetase)
MIVRVYEAVESALGADIVVAADDARIMRALDDHRVPAVLTNPNWQSGTDRVAEVARLRGWGTNDVVVNVQGDEPLIPADLLTTFARFCESREELAMATVSLPVSDHAEIIDPNVVKLMVREDSSAITFSRAPIPLDRDRPFEQWDLSNYKRHLGIYGYRNHVLQRLTSTSPCPPEEVERLEQLRALWMGIPIQVMEWHSAPPGGVDTQDDVHRVRRALESGKS